jgi:hypothetical protein
MIEGQDFSDDVIQNDTTSTVTMDERIVLNAEQAEGLRALYGARKELENRIAFAEQMVGVQGREITGGELGDKNPYLTLKSLTNGASG